MHFCPLCVCVCMCVLISTCVCMRHVYVVYVCSFTCLQVHVCISMSQNWSKLQTSGKKPPAREFHSACCLTGDHPLVMVIGGWDGSRVFSDVWLLDVTDRLWSEVLHVHSHSDNMGCTSVLICMVICIQPAELPW